MNEARKRGGCRDQGRALLVVFACAVALGALAAPSALAKAVPNEAYAKFVNCPVSVKKLEYCVVVSVTGGEFKVGSKTVTINKPITLQGGILEKSETLVPPAHGPMLSRTPLTVPGGLTGIEGVGGEVTATTELVGPVTLNSGNLLDERGIAATLPIRVKLEGPVIGNECYIGSELEPISLRLTSGTTNPPAPNAPISGTKGSLNITEGGTIVGLEGVSLVDNSFAAPGVNGCGESASSIIDPVVDLDSGLPSTAGNNTAIMDQDVAETAPKFVKKAHVIPKE